MVSGRFLWPLFFVLRIIPRPDLLMLSLCCYVIAWLILVYIKKDISISNFAWGGIVALTAVYVLTFFGFTHLRLTIVIFLLMLWAGRMAFQLYKRYKRGTDPRFARWVDLSGWQTLLFSLAWILLGQLALGITMSVPIWVIAVGNPNGFNLLDLSGVIVWMFGFLFEALADYQLYIFRANPQNKGKVLMSGLWQYSRHPNYFGEIMQWWAIWLFTLNTPYWYIALVAPFTITFLLCFVTGIPLLERAMADNNAYQEYAKRTSVLIPWFVKKRA